MIDQQRDVRDSQEKPKYVKPTLVILDTSATKSDTPNDMSGDSNALFINDTTGS